MCLTLPDVLISLYIEKVIPSFRDLEVFLQTLPRSATGERMNPYNSTWSRNAGEPTVSPKPGCLNLFVLALAAHPADKRNRQAPPPQPRQRPAEDRGAGQRIRKASKPKLAVFDNKDVAASARRPSAPAARTATARDPPRTPQELGRPGVHEAAPRHGPGRPGRPRRHGLLHHAHVRATKQLCTTTAAWASAAAPGRASTRSSTTSRSSSWAMAPSSTAAQVAISNSIKAGQDITYIILENKTTAMTGHQEHAGTEVDVLGNRSYIQEIAEIVRTMAGTGRGGGQAIARRTAHLPQRAGADDPLRRREGGHRGQGVRHHPHCTGKQERKQIKERLPPRKTHMNITPEVCEVCLECTKATACPGR